MPRDSAAILRSLLDTIPASESARVKALLALCPTIEIAPGETYFRGSFDSAPLLVVERGFVVLRASFEQSSRSIVTCEAGAGRIILPPAEEEMLFGLAESRLTALSPLATGELMSLPGAAQMLVEQLTASLGEKQENLSNSPAPDTSCGCGGSCCSWRGATAGSREMVCGSTSRSAIRYSRRWSARREKP